MPPTQIAGTHTSTEDVGRFLEELGRSMRRYRRFAALDSVAELADSLPWTLLRDVNPNENRRFFDEESFVCVVVEVAIDAPTPESFFRKAVDFANERLSGTLAAT